MSKHQIDYLYNGRFEEMRYSLATFEDLKDLTKEELVSLILDKNESGIRIDFPGKSNATQISRKVRPRVQRTIKKYGAGDLHEQSRNIVLEGDNLQAMATLYRERGQVDLILTDPPYNTGGDWRYNDKWDEDPNDPGIGDIVNSEDLARHTKWMKFMYPRLELMKLMLKPTGVLAICIDYRELFHLGQMLDELFGSKNRIGIINWQRTYSKQNDAGHLATVTEYVLVYANDIQKAKTKLLAKIRDKDASDNLDADEMPWTDGPATGSNAKKHKGMVYGIQSPFTGEILYPPENSSWRYEQEFIKTELEKWNVKYEYKDLNDLKKRAELIGVDETKVPAVKGLCIDGNIDDAKRNATEILENGVWPRFYFLRKNGTGKPRIKKYLHEMQQGEIATTFWASDDFEVTEDVSWPHQISGHSEQGVKELTAVVGPGHDFKTVKPLKLFSKIIELWCPSDGFVMDPFGGSGTTGHAVLEMNYSRGEDRRFLIIEQGRPELGDSYAKTLTAERLKRVVEGDWANKKGKPLGGGFEFRSLTKQVDAEALLAMERDEMVDTVIASYFDATKRKGSNLIRTSLESSSYLVAKNTENEGFYLIWGGPDETIDLNEEVYEKCVEEGQAAGLEPVYHIYARYNLFPTAGVKFYQIPDRILSDFGIDSIGA